MAQFYSHRRQEVESLTFTLSAIPGVASTFQRYSSFLFRENCVLGKVFISIKFNVSVNEWL